MQALDRIHDLLTMLANRRLLDTKRADADGVLRVVVPKPDWDTLVHLAFDEIRHYGRGSIQVTRRLRAALEDLKVVCPESRRAVLDVQLRAIDGDKHAFTCATDRVRSEEPSRQGQGRSCSKPVSNRAIAATRKVHLRRPRATT